MKRTTSGKVVIPPSPTVLPTVQVKKPKVRTPFDELNVIKANRQKYLDAITRDAPNANHEYFLLMTEQGTVPVGDLVFPTMLMASSYLTRIALSPDILLFVAPSGMSLLQFRELLEVITGGEIFTCLKISKSVSPDASKQIVIAPNMKWFALDITGPADYVSQDSYVGYMPSNNSPFGCTQPYRKLAPSIWKALNRAQPHDAEAKYYN